MHCALKKMNIFFKKHKYTLLFAFLALLLLAVLIVPNTVAAFANGSGSDLEYQFTRSIDDILRELDLGALEEFINSLNPEQATVFGATNAFERIRMIVSGEIALDYASFFTYILSVLGINLVAFLPFMLSILAIAISINIVSSLKSRIASESVSNIVSFVGVALISTILAVQLMGILNGARGMIGGIQSQMNTVFPVMLTLMAASGAVNSAAVYRPAVAVLSSGMLNLIANIILPIFIVTNVFSVVGNLSDTVRLKKMSRFFTIGSRWILATAFFLFMAFLSVQGITASIHDGVSVRTARFAINRYVPIIGGYLSEGFNLIMAGSSLVKNAVGFTAIIILFLNVLPVIIQTVIFTLSLHLTAAIAEPLGEKKVSDILSGVGKNMNILIATLIGTTFLYFIFIILVIATGNPSL